MARLAARDAAGRVEQTAGQVEKRADREARGREREMGRKNTIVTVLVMSEKISFLRSDLTSNRCLVCVVRSRSRG